MSEDVLVPGGRDVRATLDRPDADACVVACPPHPQFGGSRTDARLRAVSDALGGRQPAVACLRFDYGPWDDGHGELADVRNAVAWARDRFDGVALFGYSFGASLAVLAAAEETASDTGGLAAVSVLAPGATVTGAGDPVARLERVTCPVQVCYGERDDTVDWEPVVDRARDLDHPVVGFAADHHFVGQADKVAAAVAPFLADALA